MDKKDFSLVPTKAATIDEALEKTHFGRFNIKLILFSGAVLNNVILESVGISFSLPVVACDLNLSYQQQGVLGAICFLGIIVSSHFWGLLADTRGRKCTMKPMLYLGFVVTLISSFSVNFNMMVILRFLNGILISAGSATIFAYMGEFHCHKLRNRAILWATLMAAFSAIFLPILAWFFINPSWEFNIPILDITYKPWRLYFVICGLSGFICGILFEFFPESPKYLLGMNRAEEALEVLRHMHKINTAGNKKLTNDIFEINVLLADLDTPIRKVSKDSERKSFSSICMVIWNQTAPLFMLQHIRKTVLCALILFTTFFTAHGVYVWFPYILNNVMIYIENYTEPKCLCDILRFTQSGNFSTKAVDQQSEDKFCSTKLEISTYKQTIVMEVMFVILVLVVIYASKKFDRVKILFTILTLCGLCGVLSLLVQIPLLSIYLFTILLCCGAGTNVMNTIVVDIYPTNLRAMAVCISLMLGRIGSVTGSNMLGALIETHCELALYFPSAMLIAAGCLSFLVPKPKENEKTLQIKEEET